MLISDTEGVTALTTGADRDRASELAAWRVRAVEARDAGRFEDALAAYDAALDLAQQLGDQRVVDRFFLRRQAVAIELGKGGDGLPSLREILLRNADAENCFLAAYNIARAHELGRDVKKALFYARLARERAAAMDHTEWLAWSHNLIGNLLAADSRCEEALDQYRAALDSVGALQGSMRFVILYNLGYCLVATGERAEGVRFLYRAVRGLRHEGVPAHEARAQLDLCFALLGGSRLDLAERHGQRALELATQLGLEEERKNALYLLGQTARQRGQELIARQRFAQLRDRFYPDADYLVDFLLTVDVRPLLNLKA